MMKTNSINTQAEASAIMLAALQTMTTKQDPQKDLQEPAGEADGYEVYNMTSNLFPCVCVAMYETILSPTHFEENLNDGEDPYYYDTINFDDWRKLLTEKAQDYLDENVIETLKNYGLANIEACSIWSPKYYNYHNDELIMDVMMVAGWQEIMKEKIEAWRGRRVSRIRNLLGHYRHSITFIYTLQRVYRITFISQTILKYRRLNYGDKETVCKQPSGHQHEGAETEVPVYDRG